MKYRRALAIGIAFVATLTCGGATASAAPVKLAPGLGTIGSQPIVYTAPRPGVGKAAIPDTHAFHSKVSLRLAAAANRTVTPASATPDSELPRTLSRKAIPAWPQHFEVEVGIQEAKLTWAAPSNTGAGVDSYLLTYQPGDVTLVFAPNIFSTTIKDLTGDTEYFFWLRSSNAFGDSLPSTNRYTIQSPPPPPPDPAPEAGVSAPTYSGSSHVISGVTFRYQGHNLSCEEANTSMALSHQGINVGEDTILARLGVDSTPPVVVNGQLASWGNPDRAFVGNVNGLERNFTGYQANPKALIRVINSLGGRVIEWGEPGVGGYISPQEIYAQVLADHPVVAYATYDWRWHPRHDYRSEDGNMVAWIGPYDAHVYTVVGVNSGSVLVNDPIRGQYWVSKGSFEAAYSDFNMAIVFP